MAGAVLPEAARGEPGDAGVDRDLGDEAASVVAWPAGAGAERAGQGLMPGARARSTVPVKGTQPFQHRLLVK